jgi:Holliday junction resolvase-like predicted endonuclease
MSARSQVLGQRGEDSAARLLVVDDHIILDRKIHGNQAEIDMITSKPHLLVFVESKIRNLHASNCPVKSINRHKQPYLLYSLKEYFQNQLQGAENWQLDGAAFEGIPGGNTQSENFENVSA